MIKISGFTKAKSNISWTYSKPSSNYPLRLGITPKTLRDTLETARTGQNKQTTHNYYLKKSEPI